MSRLLRPLRRLQSSFFTPQRNYIAGMRRSAIHENLLRLLRSEVTYSLDYNPPRNPAANFGPFSVSDRPGEQWIRLTRHFGNDEQIKVDATMFDGAATVPEDLAKRIEAYEAGRRLHISLIVEVSKGEKVDCVLSFVCSAWPDALDVEKVFPVTRAGKLAIKPYMGKDFKELNGEMQDALREYLEERGVNDDLAEFLHEYMANKDKSELVRWLKTVEAYVQK